MTDRLTQCLLTVLANPADDGPRLVYADLLEECGQCDRAEFIRMQVELAAEHQVLGNCRAWRDENDEMDMDCGCCPACQLRILADELLAVHEAEWLAEEMGLIWVVKNIPPVKVAWKRGFVSQIECTLAVWRGRTCERCSGKGWIGYHSDDPERGGDSCPTCHGVGRTGGIGPQLVRRAPVEAVVVTDKRPHEDRDSLSHGFFWHYGWRHLADPENEPTAQCTLPEDVFRRLPPSDPLVPEGTAPRWPSADSANAALSTALLKEARETALTEPEAA